jgi:magnesium transporter
VTRHGPDSRLDELRRLAEGEDLTAFVSRAAEVHPSDLADVLAALDEPTRVRAVAELPPEIASSALAEMETGEHPEEILRAVGPDYAAELVDELPTDDAADIVAELPPEERAAVLAEVEDRADVERLLTYPEDSAGGLMTTEVVAVDQDATLAEAIAEIRLQSGEGDEPYQVYAVDRDRRLRGTIPIARLVVWPPDRRVRDVMTPTPAAVRPDQDQEQVARLMARYNLAAVPVVDQGDRLLGRITFDDVIDVVEAETTEDLLKFGGVNPHEDLTAPWTTAVRTRLPWLYVNLLTASLAGAVVFLFRETIARVVLLAVWMPIIAGMGGNAGTQALAVTVRLLALGQLPPDRAVAVVRKEALLGVVKGVAVGVVVGAAAWISGDSWLLGVVVLLAMTGNLLVAGFVGAFIPLLLRRFGIDPAVASSVFVTATTDVCGFLLLLGLGATLLL